ncbi:MAG: dephospho-CoA kinase [Planctomycetota bacterium]
MTPPAAHEPSTATRQPLTILIQGGIASGKSTVSRLLAERGAHVVDCDRVAHEQLAEPEVQAALRAAFGDGVFDAGAVSRPALGALVFSDPAALETLERIVHPRVAEVVREVLTRWARPASEPREVVVIDAAVADKMRLVERYDLRLFVEVDRATRAARAATRGWAPDELAKREANQDPLEVKRARADHVISNEGDLDQAAQRVASFWSEHVEPRR